MVKAKNTKVFYQYTIFFNGGEKLSFRSDIEIDFHKIDGKDIAFNDLYINTGLVNYMRKEIITEDI